MKRIFLVLAICVVSYGVSFAQAQSGQQQQQQTQNAMGILQSQYGGTGQTQGTGISSASMFTSSADLFRNLQGQGMTIQPPPYDAPVDTSKYLLGPGDLVNIGIWGATPLSYTLSVTPEGTLVVPAYGVLTVGGMTIAAAKDYVSKMLSQQYKSAKITLTLVYPRTFYVVVAGEVKTAGRYTATAFDRVDRVFTEANLPKFVGDISPLPPFSLRRIKLVHSNGTSQRVDLLKFYQSGDVSDDPYLQQGDAIIVPRENFALGSLSISGGVKMAGTYEYVHGDRIKDLLEISQGLTRIADSTHVEVFEPNGHGGYEENIVNLEDSSSIDMPLPANTRVVVPIDRNKMDNFYVYVDGEVNVPGIYPISPDTTTLAQIIKLAGGFTKWASLPTAVIYRTREPNVFTPPQPTNPSFFTNRAADVTQEDLSYASQELSMRAGREVVSTDFVKLFVDKNEKYNVTLRAGDSIYVPQSQRAVYVLGQVRYPGYISYQSGWNAEDYIAAAGGAKEGAENTIRILKQGTYQWYKPGETHIEPGDLVFVPRVSIKPELYSWNLFKDIIGTVGSVASVAVTAILLIRTLQGK